MNKLYITIILFTYIFQSQGAVPKGMLTVEPIIGYEQVQKLEPTPHIRNRLVYGVRAIYGLPLLSAEAEVTKADDTESFPSQDLSIKEDAINGKLGIRSRFLSTSFLSLFIRLGGHARKSTIETTTAGVTTTKEPAIRISPYAGAGFGFRFNNMFRFNAGITAIFTGQPKGSDREYQTTAGFSIKI